MEQGFYKNDGGELFFAPNFVYGPSLELLIAKKDTYTYPVDGWTFFSTRQEALDAFGIIE
jgi:hypothetical protein